MCISQEHDKLIENYCLTSTSTGTLYSPVGTETQGSKATHLTIVCPELFFLVVFIPFMILQKNHVLCHVNAFTMCILTAGKGQIC